MAMKVAVVGCGAAGLCALRHLNAQPRLFRAVGFEQSAGLGGTWRYTDRVGKDENGLPVHSSMYKDLRTNIPKEVMAFPGFDFPSHLPSFIKHEDVLQYLEDYCDEYDLTKHIKYETMVDSIDMVKNGSKPWDKAHITYRSVKDETNKEKDIFDAVIVCAGHYSIPLMPRLRGQEEYQGNLMHSHEYRVPEAFKGQTVVCLGAAASGQDVSLNLASHAKKVILSHNKPVLETPLPSNVVQHLGIDKLTKDSVIFKNGVEEKVDTVMLCTGYRYDFPFLQDSCKLDIEEERLFPLYKHIIHTHHPNLSFVGLCKIICPFPQFDTQIRFIKSILDGTQKLPSQADMEADIENDYQQRMKEGLPHRHAHTMGPRQWEYNETLAELGEFEPIPKAIQMLYDEVHRSRVLDLPNYKNKNYRLTGAESYEEVLEREEISLQA